MEAEEEKIVEHAKEAIHALTDKRKIGKQKSAVFFGKFSSSLLP